MDSMICFMCENHLTQSRTWRVVQLCGHVFHESCLLDRFQSTPIGERQRCPQCGIPCEFNRTNIVCPIFQPAARNTCPNNCPLDRAARLWCLKHRRCNSECSGYRRRGIQVFSFEENGSFYCQHCVNMWCPTCERRIDNDCVENANGWVYHEECFRCVGCDVPLGSYGGSLTDKSYRYHDECLNCYVCGYNVAGKAYSFLGVRPLCVGCYRP